MISHAVYNVYFHPLASFPGPKYAAVSQIPVAWRSWNGTLHEWLRGLHDAYDSDVVRISPWELSLISPEAWKDVYSSRPGHPGFPKDPVGFGGKNSILTADNPDHSRMRRLLSHAFSEKALREQKPLVQVHIDNLIGGIQKQIDSPAKGEINVVDWCHWITFDIIGDLAFGEPFDCLANLQYTPWVEKLMQGLKAVASVSVAMRFSLLARFLQFYISKTAMVKDALEHGRLSKEKVNRRLQNGSSRPDFISYIVKHNTEKAGMTQAEINRNASVFINAGSQTTATFLCGAIWFILQYPEYTARMRTEIREMEKAEGLNKVQNLNQLRLLQAFIQECHRVYPGTLSGLPRSAASPGDTADKVVIPGGTGVHLNQYAAYRSCRNFRDPDMFIPERWLDHDLYKTDRKEVLQPFAMGPRNCLGKNLANAEIGLILVHLLLAFEVQSFDKTDPMWTNQKAWFGWDKKPLWVRMVRRQ